MFINYKINCNLRYKNFNIWTDHQKRSVPGRINIINNRKYLLLLAYLPFVLSPVILAVCLKFYFNKMNISGTFLGVVLAQMIIAFPYCIIFFIGFWNQRIRLNGWFHWDGNNSSLTERNYSAALAGGAPRLP